MAGGQTDAIQSITVRPMAYSMSEVGQCRGENAKCE